ncbi:hypothetical protein BDR03DRAFT_970685 [Suillus americanus]|nr:hypothetical protein BDR03DRAFT_970685 [Suillus americanus]
MRFPIVLAVVAALTTSIFARPADVDVDAKVCPLFCLRQSNCKNCPDKNCIIYICF